MNQNLLSASCSASLRFLVFGCTAFLLGVVNADPIPIKAIQRDKPVDFATEIYPILKQNCLACHHQKEAEGGLNLESHALLMEGGDSGPGAVAKDAAKSLILTRASGTEDDLMPPEDNGVGAKTLTSEQLGLIQLWIQQGAEGADVAAPETIDWQPIPDSVKAIYAIDASPDGLWIAAGHGNRVTVYDANSADPVATLSDSSLEPISGPGVADVDLIQSIAFSPDGERIATGGFRSVRIWRKQPATSIKDITSLDSASGVIVPRSDRSKVAVVNAIGDIEIWNMAGKKREHVLRGHAETVTDIGWAGDHLFTCDSSGWIHVWNTVDGSKLVSKNTMRSVTGIAVLPDGTAIAAIDAGGKVTFWRLSSQEGKLSFTDAALEGIKSLADATSIVISTKPSPRLYVGTKTNSVLVINLQDGKQLHKIDAGGSVSAIAVSPDESQIAVAKTDGKIGLWKITDHKAVRTLDGSPDSKLRVAAAQRDANRQTAAVKRMTAATAALEKAVTKEDEAVKKIVEARDKAVKDLAAKEKTRVDATAKVAATETLIAKAKSDTETATKNNDAAQKLITDATAKIQTLNTELVAKNAELTKVNEQMAAVQKQLAAAQKAMADAKGMADKLTQVITTKKTSLDAENKKIAEAKKQVETTKKVIADAKAIQDKSTKDLEAQKKAVAKADEEKKKSEAEVAKRKQALAAATQAQERAKSAVPAHKLLVEVATRKSEMLQKQLVSIQTLAAAPTNGCRDVAFSPDGAMIASTHLDGSVRIYRSDTGLAIRSLKDSAMRSQVAFLSNQALCAYGLTSHSRGWNVTTTWELERTIGHHDKTVISDRVTAIDFRSDGRSIAIGSGPPSRSGDVKIFAVETGKLLRDFGDVHSDTVLGLRFSPDGRSIASSAADKTVRYLDIASGEVVRSFEGHTHHVLAVDWQDDGQTLASASADQNVKVWNAQTGEQRRTISGFGKEITAIAFVQQTNQVMSACADGNLRLHDSNNGRQIRAFSASGDFLYSLAISADGSKLIGGGQSGILRVWNIADGKLLKEVK